MILSLSFAVLKHKLSLLLFILPGQGNITKVFAIWSFPNSCYIQPELKTILLNFFFETLLFSILGQSDPGPTDAQNTWMSFDLKEHKIHNNVSLVMGHLSLLWSNYQEYMKYQNPHMWGENVRKRNYQFPEDIGDFSPYMGAVGIETYDGEM